LLAVLACVAATSAKAQDAVADFFRGKQITIYVGSSAGGGYDAYARLIARYFGNHIPGNPTVVVENMPGAASNKAAGYIYSVAPKEALPWRRCFPARCSIR
jgi:tripartite-type tricarboxylate transporter receptor subunit TctC